MGAKSVVAVPKFEFWHPKKPVLSEMKLTTNPLKEQNHHALRLSQSQNVGHGTVHDFVKNTYLIIHVHAL